MNIAQHGILHEIEQSHSSFSLAFIGIFTVTFVILAIVGATPDLTFSLDGTHASVPAVAASNTPEQPVRIAIDSIALSASVSNPTSTDNDVLDTYLAKGAVRYASSAELGAQGTVLLFGHSSYLPIVHNQAYKTFDGIQNLQKGDVISVYSATREYRYTVTSVRTANAKEDTVALASSGQHLTLITCDSFGTKSDRFVVTADLAGTYSLAQ